MKIAFIGDIHHGTTRESSTHPGMVRLESGLALATLSQTLPRVLSHAPDLVVQMGDVIRDAFEKETDKTHFDAVVGMFSTISTPLVSMLGNHDVLALSRSEITDIHEKHAVDSMFLGVKDFGTFQLVWLDLEMRENVGYLTDEGLALLSNLDPHKPALICSHYALTSWNPVGNFLTRPGKENASWISYANSHEALTILAQKKVLGMVNAHAHWGAYRIDNGVPCFTNPAFSENVFSQEAKNVNPGVYSILETDGKSLSFKSFSGDWAFFNIEV